jgi:hypothetical protein
LCGIRTQQPIFERRSVKALDDRLHLFLIGGLDEGESFGFLSFWIANYFDVIGYQILGRQPRLNVVRRHPHGQIAKKYSQAHPFLLILHPFE